MRSPVPDFARSEAEALPESPSERSPSSCRRVCLQSWICVKKHPIHTDTMGHDGSLGVRRHHLSKTACIIHKFFHSCSAVCSAPEDTKPPLSARKRRWAVSCLDRAARQQLDISSDYNIRAVFLDLQGKDLDKAWSRHKKAESRKAAQQDT